MYKLYRSTSRHVFLSEITVSVTFWSTGILRRCFSRYINKLKCRDNPAIMKLDIPEFRSILTPELNVLSEMFKNYGYEIRIAGGAVRDLLSGKQPTDIDLATTATPDQMKEMFTREKIRVLNIKGEKHGTIASRINDKQNFEVTTLRIDVDTDGRHAVVEYTTDWKKDASRRDLTINSMFMGLDGTVYDYFHGYDDLKNKRVVFVGDAEERIREDYLRILRYFRFYGRIADDPDKHDPGVLESIKKTIHGLEIISGERIWSELTKILSGQFAVELILKMIEVGISPYVAFPDNPNVAELQRVWKTVGPSNVLPPTLIAGMFNDEYDVLRFHLRMRMSTFDRDLCRFIVNHRTNDSTPELFLKEMKYILVFTKLKYDNQKKYIKELLKYRNMIDLLDPIEKFMVPRCPINGTILKEQGIYGQKIGVVLKALKEEWIVSDFKLTKEQLLDMIPNVTAEQEAKKFKAESV